MRKKIGNRVGIYYDLECFPDELFNIDERWHELILNFHDKIHLTDEIFKLDVLIFHVRGEVSRSEKSYFEKLQIKVYHEKEINLIINGIWPCDLDGFWTYSDKIL